MRSPNILFVMFDQMAPRALPLYGHELVQAPYLSALAERGVVEAGVYARTLNLGYDEEANHRAVRYLYDTDRRARIPRRDPPPFDAP